MNDVLHQVLYGLVLFLEIASYVLIINALLSWFVPPHNAIRQLLGRFLNPIVSPFRRLNDKIVRGRMPIDLAPMMAYFALMLIIILLEQIMIRL